MCTSHNKKCMLDWATLQQNVYELNDNNKKERRKTHFSESIEYIECICITTGLTQK